MDTGGHKGSIKGVVPRIWHGTTLSAGVNGDSVGPPRIGSVAQAPPDLLALELDKALSSKVLRRKERSRVVDNVQGARQLYQLEASQRTTNSEHNLESTGAGRIVSAPPSFSLRWFHNALVCGWRVLISCTV